jgi:hypothetical protein
VGFVVDKVALGQVFPEYFGFLLSIPFHRCSITWKNEKTVIIFITELRNKPQGCGASVASAAGPFTKKIQNIINSIHVHFFLKTVSFHKDGKSH